ncbi:MAG: hypothetical protein RR585_00290 [Coprobacillus sp.]
MKKLLMLMMCMMVLAGCASDPKVDESNANNNNNNTTNDTTDNSVADKVSDWYNRFESEMKNKSIAYTSREKLDATAIGGVEGYRYVTENGNIDVYRFENGDEYNKIMKDKKIRLNDKDYNVEVRNNMVIVSDKLSDDVKDIFNGMK